MRFWPQDYCNLIGATIFLQLGQVRYRHDTTLAFPASSSFLHFYSRYKVEVIHLRLTSHKTVLDTVTLTWNLVCARLIRNLRVCGLATWRGVAFT